MPRARHGSGGGLISARFWLLVINPFSARKLFRQCDPLTNTSEKIIILGVGWVRPNEKIADIAVRFIVPLYPVRRKALAFRLEVADNKLL
jgi:hypothetical protein